MKTLLIDSGNTSIKYGIWDDGVFAYLNSIMPNSSSLYELPSLSFDRVLISDVASRREALNEIFKTHEIEFLDSESKLPFNINYDSPKTLGADRIAAVAFASEKYNSNCLVIDLGTCITIDFLDSQKVYHGGLISPGVNARFKSMHDYTGSLPLLSSEDLADLEFPAKTTRNSMIYGVMEGIRSELQNFIDEYSNKFDDLCVIMGGGDKKFFESKLKGNIFAAENLILEGLSSIQSFHDTH